MSKTHREKIEGKRRKAWQRMRRLNSITDSMVMNLSKLQETGKDRGAWRAAVHGVAKSQTRLSTVHSLSPARLSVTPWTAASQASLSFTTSWSLLKLTSTESVMPSNHLVLCCLLLLPSVFLSIRVFSNESVLHIRWPVLELQLQHQSFQ